MLLCRTALRQTPLAFRRLVSQPPVARQWPRYASSSGPERRGGFVGKLVGGLVVAGAVGGAIALYPTATQEPPKRKEAVIEYEKTRPELGSKEDNRDWISSQHLQVKKSWENPGVYIWGSNSGRVAAPESNEPVVKTPRRLAYFDGQLLRDIKLDRDFGAAVTERGDLVQWGTAFSPTNPTPVTTLRGKDLVKIGISRDRIVALSKNGAVYSIPVSGSDQARGDKPQQSSWFPFWSASDQINYRHIKPANLSWGETITDIASGLEHALLLTSKGRLFSVAASTSDFPSKGQLGIPGLTWTTRPEGPFDRPHEISMLKEHKIKQIAAGDYHSLALDDKGRAFVFGDNSSGQLGFEPEHEIPYVDGPIPLPFQKIYSGSSQQPSVTGIAAGGANSFFMVDATTKEGQGNAKDWGRVTADTWACGAGITGSLGTGKWTHVSLGPSKVKPLSGLFEWDEKADSVVPIRIARLSVGSTHAAAVMGNGTRVVTGAASDSGGSSSSSSENDTSYGADILFWGGNEHYQLGTGRRNNMATPSYIGPLDGGKGAAEKGRKGEEHRFQITPRATARLGEGGKGRKVSMEQRVECGRHVTAVYSAT